MTAYLLDGPESLWVDGWRSFVDASCPCAGLAVFWAVAFIRLASSSDRPSADCMGGSVVVAEVNVAIAVSSRCNILLMAGLPMLDSLTIFCVSRSVFANCSSLLDPGMWRGSGKNCTMLETRLVPVDLIRQLYDLYVSMADPSKNPTSP